MVGGQCHIVDFGCAVRLGRVQDDQVGQRPKFRWWMLQGVSSVWQCRRAGWKLSRFVWLLYWEEWVQECGGMQMRGKRWRRGMFFIISCSIIQKVNFVTGSLTINAAYPATRTVLGVAHIKSLRGLVLNLSVPFLLSPFTAYLAHLCTQLHTDGVTPRQLSDTQTVELTKKDSCCSIGGACCSTASTVKSPCSNESTKLPSTTLPSTCCAKWDDCEFHSRRIANYMVQVLVKWQK